MDQRLLGSARAYLDLVRSIIVVLRGDGTVSYVNPWTTQLMEYAPDDMVGKNFFDHFQPEDAGKDSRQNFHLLLSGANGLQQRESYVKTGGGAIILIHWYHSVLKDEKGRVLGTLSSGEDITEKRVLKERLAQERALSRRQVMQAVLERAERERRELSYLLHDGANQKLTVCKILLEEELINYPKAALLARASTLVSEVISELREISHGLSAYGLKKGGLDAAVKEMAATINTLGNVKVMLQIKGVRYLKQLSEERALALLRIVQENTGNILKYARATCIDILLIGGSKGVDLEIRENGSGFEKGKVVKGMGLSTIYSRAEVLGGRAYLSSMPGEGSLLSVHLPQE